MVESWVEHLRQHERVTVADRAAEEKAKAFHVDPEPIVVTHWVATTSAGEAMGELFARSDGARAEPTLRSIP